ncbi:MAG: hypothetical protein ACOX1O_00110 [Eggerthellaceae bacterium]
MLLYLLLDELDFDFEVLLDELLLLVLSVEVFTVSVMVSPCSAVVG